MKRLDSLVALWPESMIVNIKELFAQRYPGEGEGKILREGLIDVCNRFVESGMADKKFTKELCSGSEAKYWSCLSEALIGAHLDHAGIKPTPTSESGPDFLIVENGRKIWIEVICPEPCGVPLDWLNMQNGANFPHNQILLRWTSAIKEKAEKLIGSEDNSVKGYIEKGIVASEDAYVIAVNGCQLRSGAFPCLNGISQFPFAVEAVFAVGPYQIKINRDTLEKKSAGHQHRPLIDKPKGEPVPAYTFLDERFYPISAIWAVDLNGSLLIGNSEPMAVIHNPNANNSLNLGFLPSNNEYIATKISIEEYELKRVGGSMIVQPSA